MTGEPKTQDIEMINQQLFELKEQIDKANAESVACMEKRDKLNEQFKSLRQEIHLLRTERDKLNELVKSLKQRRDEAQARIRATIEETKEHRQKIADLQKKAPRGCHKEIQEELDGIEWKIQTTSLDLQEEKRLIDHVKELETQLSVYRKIEKQYKIINESETELNGIKTKRDTVHQELTGFASKSQELHASMLSKIKVSKAIKDEADALHGAYLQARTKFRPLRDQMILLMAQKRALIDQRKALIAKERTSTHLLREENERQKKAKEQEMKEKLGLEAKEKLQRGEKLNWQEFQLLGEDEPETDSKTQD